MTSHGLRIHFLIRWWYGCFGKLTTEVSISFLTLWFLRDTNSYFCWRIHKVRRNKFRFSRSAIENFAWFLPYWLQGIEFDVLFFSGPSQHILLSKLPSIYGPDNFHSLPLCSGITSKALPNWCPPPTAEITHYSHRLRLCAPVVAPAAILCLIIQADAFRDSTNIPQLTGSAPLNRSEAVARGYEGPTMEDVTDYHLNTRIHTANRRPPFVDLQFRQDIPLEGSESEDQCRKSGLSSSVAYDHDWYRIVACIHPWLGDMPLRGPVFTPGILTGRWAGTLLVMSFTISLEYTSAHWPEIFQSGDFELHTTLLNDDVNNRPAHVSVRQFPLYWELQEHHCFSENEVLPPGTDGQFGDDILNAWIPRGSIFSRTNVRHYLFIIFYVLFPFHAYTLYRIRWKYTIQTLGKLLAILRCFPGRRLLTMLPMRSVQEAAFLRNRTTWRFPRKMLWNQCLILWIREQALIPASPSTMTSNTATQ